MIISVEVVTLCFTQNQLWEILDQVYGVGPWSS